MNTLVTVITICLKRTIENCRFCKELGLVHRDERVGCLKHYIISLTVVSSTGIQCYAIESCMVTVYYGSKWEFNQNASVQKKTQCHFSKRTMGCLSYKNIHTHLDVINIRHIND